MSEVLVIEPLQVDKQAIAQAFGKAAQKYDQHAEFQRQVADRLLAKLPIKLTGLRVLDLGCGTGYCSQILQQRGANVVCADISVDMLQAAKQRCGDENMRYFVADAEQLPFADQEFDLIISSLALQWCHDLCSVLRELKRSVKPGGKVLFSTLLDGSLYELKAAWSKIDAYQHVNEFMSLNQVNIALAQSDCINHQLDLPTMIMWYRRAFDLMRDLKGIGANHVEGRSRGFTSSKTLKQLEQHYQEFANQEGKISASYRVCIGTILL